MSSPNRNNFAKAPKKTQLLEAYCTPEELAQYLGQTNDITIIGEIHTSQPLLDLQAEMFEASKAEMLFSENPPSAQKNLDNSRSRDDFVGSWGTVSEAEYVAHKLKTPNKAVDVEHHESPNSSRLLLEVAEHQYGLGEAAVEVFSSVSEAMGARGVDLDAIRIEEGELEVTKNVSEVMEIFISAYEKELPDFHKANLRELGSDIDRETKIAEGSKLAKLAKLFDSIDDARIVHKAADRRMKESDTAMAENIDGHLEKLQAIDPDANGVFVVGSDHNKGVEDKLEKKGYDVANVKIETTDNPDLDRRVFKNPRPNSREDAEWIVAVYDPECKFAKDFEKNYKVKLRPEEESKTSLDLKNARAQADEVMRGEERKTSSVAMNELPQQQRLAELGSSLGSSLA